jgi:hypothetical protein
MEIVNMFKYIVFFVSMTAYTPFYCIAAESVVTSLNDLTVNSFEVSEIPDLGHPVCTLSLSDNKKDDFYNYVEGSICPAGGGSCTYSAIMKINNNLTILKKISSNKNSETFQNPQFSIISIHTSASESEVDSEGTNVEYAIFISINNNIRKLDMNGYCGI